MPSQPPIPPLLSPDLYNLPYSSLILLTSTLGATTSWLAVRFVCAALKSKLYGAAGNVHHIQGNSYHQRIILVSWLRDETWWRESGRKLGIDFEKVHLVDGLSNELGVTSVWNSDVRKAIAKATGSKGNWNDGDKIVLVLDGLDFLLAATGCEVLGLLDTIGELREVRILSNSWLCATAKRGTDKQQVHSVIIATAANLPPSQSPSTPLDVSHTAFVMSLAHQANMIMSVRTLDTGVAKDVSGVLRIIKRAGESVDDGHAEGRECLYYVGSDAGLKVFERGA